MAYVRKCHFYAYTIAEYNILVASPECDDVNMPLFDAQQWKVLTSACHCLTHNNGNVNHSPYRHVNHSLCGECPYILG